MIKLRTLLEELAAWCEDLVDAWHDRSASQDTPAEVTAAPGPGTLLVLLLQAYGESTTITRTGLVARLYFLSRLLGDEIDLEWFTSRAGPRSIAVGAALGRLRADRLLECLEHWNDGHDSTLVRLTPLGAAWAGRLGVQQPVWWSKINEATDRLREAAAELEVIDPRQADEHWERAAQIAAGRLLVQQRALELLLAADDILFEDNSLEILRRLDLLPEPTRKGPGAGGATPGPRGGNTLS